MSRAAATQITDNQRNAFWETWSTKFGFDAMGIWEDGADRTDVNSVDRSRRGAPVWDTNQDVAFPKTDQESAEWTQGGSYLVTSEDSSLIKIFNFPVVQVGPRRTLLNGGSLPPAPFALAAPSLTLSASLLPCAFPRHACFPSPIRSRACRAVAQG